jgi:hypothetical protein
MQAIFLLLKNPQNPGLSANEPLFVTTTLFGSIGHVCQTVIYHISWNTLNLTTYWKFGVRFLLKSSTLYIWTSSTVHTYWGRFFCREPAKLRSRQGWTLTLMSTTGHGSGHGSGSGTAQDELWLKNRPLRMFRVVIIFQMSNCWNILAYLKFVWQ